jgi:tetratricopeptide (TPR) repeat protein
MCPTHFPMSLTSASSKIWFNLPLYTQQHLLLLREVKYYLTVEPIILQVLITILNTYLPSRNYALDTMLQSLDIAQRYGWLDKDPLTAMIRIHPLFACFLRAQAPDSEDENTPHCFMEFYSAYANYILEQYLQSGKDELRLEGFKVVFFEFFNFERALYHAIATQDDFLHIYHLLDHTLDANEDHLNRLHFTQRAIHFAEKSRFDDEMLYLQYVQLQSFLADIHYRIGDYPEAERLYRSALDVFRTNSAYQESAMVLVNLANILSDQGRYEMAIAYYKEAIDLVQQHAAPDERMEPI